MVWRRKGGLADGRTDGNKIGLGSGWVECVECVGWGRRFILIWARCMYTVSGKEDGWVVVLNVFLKCKKARGYLCLNCIYGV